MPFYLVFNFHFKGAYNNTISEVNLEINQDKVIQTIEDEYLQVCFNIATFPPSSRAQPRWSTQRPD